MLVFRAILRPVIFGFFLYAYLFLIAHSLQTDLASTLLVPLIILFFPLAAMELLVSYISMKLFKEEYNSFRHGTIKRIAILYILYFTWIILLHAAPLIKHYINTDIDSFLEEGVFILISHPWWLLITGFILLCICAIFFRSKSKGSFIFSIIIPPLFLIIANANFNFDITGGIQKPFIERKLNLKGAKIYKHPEYQCEKYFWPRLQSSLKFPGVPVIDARHGKIFLPVGTNLDYSGCPNIISFNLYGNGTISKTVENSKHPQRKLIRNILLDNVTDQLIVMPFTDWREMLMFNKESLEIERDISFRVFSKDVLNELTVINSTILDVGRRRVFISTGSPPSLIRVSLEAKYGTDTTSHFALNDLSVHGVDLYASLKNLIYDHEKNLLYASLVESGHHSKILEFNPETLEILRGIEIDHEISSIELDSRRNRIYATLKWSRIILVSSRTKMKVIETRSAPALFIPMLRVDPNRDLIYIVDYLRGRLIIMDRDLRSVPQIWNVGSKPQGIDMDSEGIYVASTLGVVKIKYASLITH